ncbi:MAG: hypothetical protein PHI70_04120 [Proteiniphilum sp.]|nr:hypothetical protein [Proteiniphilum sp.]
MKTKVNTMSLKAMSRDVRNIGSLLCFGYPLLLKAVAQAAL